MFWTRPGDDDYDERRALFNRMVERRPRLIAGCETAADVGEALQRARFDSLPVAVRAGGHSVAGMSTVEDGLVIDVRPMKQIKIDPSRRWARVGAGVTWGEFDRAAQEHGLAVTGGRASTTGVAGFTLGGGSGWLDRKFGLACDSLLAVDLVTADGSTIRVDDRHHPDLFWGLHGGGGNFGVATAFEFLLHPVGPTVQAGLLAWPATRADGLSRAYRDWVDRAPDELGSGFIMVNGGEEEFVPPHLQNRLLVIVAALWAGDPDDGADYLGTLRDLEPDIDLVAPRPYAEFQTMIDDPPGNRHYWSADYHDELSDDALDVFVESGQSAPSPLTQQIIFAWGGAASRIPEAATPMTKRASQWVTHPFAVWENAVDDPVNVEWVRQFRRDMAPYTNGGVYLNFVGDEGEERVRNAYGEAKLSRLMDLKAEYDPENVFRGNQNIAPTRRVSSPG